MTRDPCPPCPCLCVHPGLWWRQVDAVTMQNVCQHIPIAILINFYDARTQHGNWELFPFNSKMRISQFRTVLFGCSWIVFDCRSTHCSPTILVMNIKYFTPKIFPLFRCRKLFTDALFLIFKLDGILYNERNWNLWWINGPREGWCGTAQFC